MWKPRPVGQQRDPNPDRFHVNPTFRLIGGNFHWAVLVRKCCPRILNLVRRDDQLGKYREAFCKLRGPDDAIKKVLELHHNALFVAFQ